MLKDVQIRSPHMSKTQRGNKKRKAASDADAPEATGAEKSAEPPSKRQMKDVAEESGSSASGSHAVKRPEPTDADLLLVGLNEVTKQIERNNVQLVVVAKQLEPARIIQHLPVLCTLRSVPLLAAPVTNLDLGQFFQLPSVICFAIKVRLHRHHARNPTILIMFFPPEITQRDSI
jgi:ribosomal protein L7Ae-like RNA K-turn-binding protein